MILNTVWSNGFDNSIEIALSKLFDSMPQVLKNFFIGFSSFGDLGLFLILVAILFLFSKKTRKIGIVFGISLVFSLVINDIILKNIFSRTRPYADPNLVTQLVSVQNNGGVPYGIIPGKNSFPSGHTFSSFICLSSLVCLSIDDKFNRKFYTPYIIFFSIYSVLMGFTRILLSHHYTTDVLAGLGFGILSGILSFFAYKLIESLIKRIKLKTSN